ncbi:YTH domain-containing family protein [Teleopsis dalmanni]|uniref:YTH domain-containing family protein n=1 Tax=Teleopsis dalmanni TaxID=139649 RepID=UPI0018CF18A9|nr:YTH domain-containing family protein [Teleopsis dalmanni]
MSSGGVSDQIKIAGNSAKNNEERNVPWSQQVDEASYENLAFPSNDNIVSNNNLTQFQYPPFNVKENQNASWNNFKSRKSNNSEINKKYNKPSFYNNLKRDDNPPNTWGNSRKIISDMSGNSNHSNRASTDFSTARLESRSSFVSSVEEKKTSSSTIAAPKKTTWASIASQPAKLISRTTLTTSIHKKKGPGMPPPPMVPGKHNLDVNSWEVPNNNPLPVPSPPPPILTYTEQNIKSTIICSESNIGTCAAKSLKGTDFIKNDKDSGYDNCNFIKNKNSPNVQMRKNWSSQTSTESRQGGSFNKMRNDSNGSGNSNRLTERKAYGGANNTSIDLRKENNTRVTQQAPYVKENSLDSGQAVLDELRDKNNYNPSNIDLEKASLARFFVIKSYSEDDIHRSIKYEIWCSTDHGNKRLDDAFKERQKENGNILLFFSVNGSGHFCGMAQMMTPVDYNSTSSVWSQDKWKGKFKVKWIYVKDVPNNKLRHILLENNENKSVTNSRDTQEVPNAKGIEVLQILHSYQHKTSIFDDFYHYEKKQVEESTIKKPLHHEHNNLSQNHSPNSRLFTRQNEDREMRTGPSKYSNNNSGSSFRDRNNLHKGNNYHNNYNEHRRYDGNRFPSNADYPYKERDIDTDRENTTLSNRYSLKVDSNRREERTQSKQNRDRDSNNDDHNKSDLRIRSMK